MHIHHITHTHTGHTPSHKHMHSDTSHTTHYTPCSCTCYAFTHTHTTMVTYPFTCTTYRVQSYMLSHHIQRHTHTTLSTHYTHSLVPRPPHPAFVPCSTKSGGRPGRSRHVIHTTIDIMASLLELITQGMRPLYVPISTRADGNGRRQRLEASHQSRIREQ